MAAGAGEGTEVYVVDGREAYHTKNERARPGLLLAEYSGLVPRNLDEVWQSGRCILIIQQNLSRWCYNLHDGSRR